MSLTVDHQVFANPSRMADREIQRHDAHELVGEGSTAIIMLNGQEYTLRITRQGKLLLTK